MRAGISGRRELEVEVRLVLGTGLGKAELVILRGQALAPQDGACTTGNVGRTGAGQRQRPQLLASGHPLPPIARHGGTRPFCLISFCHQADPRTLGGDLHKGFTLGNMRLSGESPFSLFKF